MEKDGHVKRPVPTDASDLIRKDILNQPTHCKQLNPIYTENTKLPGRVDLKFKLYISACAPSTK